MTDDKIADKSQQKILIPSNSLSGATSVGKYAVTCKGLNKSFGQLKVLNDLSIAIPRGVTYCLLGPNGSGKTTLIRIIVGLLRRDSGDMQVLDRPVSEVQEIYSKIGYMTQHKALYPDLTLQENMEFFAGLYGIRGQKMFEKITELLEMVDLTEHRHSLAGELSGGMYQRLSLACTLIHEPELLLLDEPTVGIDPRLRQTFWNYFNRLAAGGVTILITIHLMDEAEKCKIAGYMRGGRMLAEGSPEEIKKIAGLHPVMRLQLNDPGQAALKLSQMGYEVHLSGQDRQELLVFLDSHRQIQEVLDATDPLDLRLFEPTLEEAFLRLAEVDMQ
jgi:ABC-2 type transport system ATP-binding protein